MHDLGVWHSSCWKMLIVSEEIWLFFIFSFVVSQYSNELRAAMYGVIVKPNMFLAGQLECVCILVLRVSSVQPDSS